MGRVTGVNRWIFADVLMPESGYRQVFSQSNLSMPPTVRDLISALERAGFKDRGGKGSHRNFVHPRLSKPVTISGKLGDDAKRYQIRAVWSALAELQK